MSNPNNVKPTKTKKVIQLSAEQAKLFKEKTEGLSNAEKKKVLEQQGIKPVVKDANQKPNVAPNIGNMMKGLMPEMSNLSEEERVSTMSFIEDDENFNKTLNLAFANSPFGASFKGLLGSESMQKTMKDVARSVLHGKPTNTTATTVETKPPVQTAKSTKRDIVSSMENLSVKVGKTEEPIFETESSAKNRVPNVTYHGEVVQTTEQIQQEQPIPAQLPDVSQVMEDVVKFIPDIIGGFKLDNLTQEDVDALEEEEEEETEEDKSKQLVIPTMFTNNMIALMNFLIDKVPSAKSTYENYKTLIVQMAEIDPLKPITVWGESIEGHDHIFRACTPETIDELRMHAETDFFLKMLMFKQNWPIFAKDKNNIEELWKIFGGMMTVYDMYKDFPPQMSVLLTDFAQNVTGSMDNNLQNILPAFQKQTQAMSTDPNFKKKILKMALEFQKTSKIGSATGDDRVDEIANSINIRRSNIV